MGGYGSGRWDGVRTRTTTGQCYALRPSALRDALRGTGGRMVLTWSRGGRELASIGAEVTHGEAPAVVLRYAASAAGGERREIAEWVPLDQVPQLGAAAGVRWWWRCLGCGRRCGVLYLPPDRARFRCRTCYRLTYASSNESDKRISRAVRALQQGDGIGDVGAMGVTALGVWLMASRVYRKRAARALRRDVGKREYRRRYSWLEQV